MLEEDMKTHMLLTHLENDMHCPLCSLSGVSYDELCYHINNAHHEDQNSPRTRSDNAAYRAPNIRFSQSSQSCVITACNGKDKKNSPTSSPVKSRNSVGNSGLTPVRPKSQQTVKHASEDSDEQGKSKRLCSATKERQFPCPICALVCSDSLTLQEHVELHLDPHNKAQCESQFQCPMCSVVCTDGISLQEHVELHLDQGATVNMSPGSDLRLARRLQEEEEQRRREEEAQVEKEQFKKLQKQFGLDGSGGYRKQMETRLEKSVARGLMDPMEFHSKRAEMMEALASGLDDGRTRTQGVLQALYEFYQTEARDSVHVWLSTDADHYCSSEGDRGWGCGYRNFQMLLSSLLRLEEYKTVISDMPVPSIPRIQALIEEAWVKGLDPQGASHFNHKLKGTRAWIGATEIYSLLTALRIRAHIVDFHQPTGPGDTHPRLFEWVRQYFSQSLKSGRIPPRIIQTSLPPLYLQHQGHSRTVVGLEQKKNGSLCLLILDPGSSVADIRKMQNRDTITAAIRQIRKFPSALKHRQYQLVAAQGVLSEQEKRVKIYATWPLY